MSLLLTRKTIKSLCDRLSYEKGLAYYRAGKVTFQQYDTEMSSYEAIVKADKSSSYRVQVQFDELGEVKAECECLTLQSYQKYCGHIGAVLLHIQDAQPSGHQPPPLNRAALSADSGPLLHSNTAQEEREGGGISLKDRRLAGDLLGLFEPRQPLRPGRNRLVTDPRTVLEVEITLKPVPYGYRKTMFGIELKLGLQRLYIVHDIREALERIYRRETIAFSKHFTYDPEVHCFQAEHDDIIRQLIQLCHNESILQEPTAAKPLRIGSDRMMLIPPAQWESLYPLLVSAPTVRLEADGHVYDGLRLTDEALPLRYTFDQNGNEGYRLSVEGLEKLTMLESYGMALADGKLLKLKDDQCVRLSGLKQMLDASGTSEMVIPPEQIEPFMEKVVPGLMKLGTVHIAQSVSDRVLQTELKAKLYLDRVRDRLLAGLEFQYGDMVFNPLESARQSRSTDRILMRDGDKERRILELLEQSTFVMTEEGFYMDDEEGEYEFLYHTVPELEKLAQVYATSAVKARIIAKHAPPTITVDVNERTDWLEIKFDMAGIAEAELRGLLQSLEEKRKYYKLPNGALLPLESAAFQEIVRFMNEVGVRSIDVKQAQFRLPAVRGLRLMDAQLQGRAVQLSKSFRRLLENMRNPDHLDFPVPETLAPIMRDYQKYGYQWLKTLAHYHFGGILADDMGLGKTLQSIAYLVSILPDIRDKNLPALIVAPASLMYHWHAELQSFAPHLRAVVVDGSKPERTAALKRSEEADVLITSYPLLRRDMELYVKHLFHTLILDEAQAFKNHTTQTAQAVKELQATYRFALTGTPVENSLEELWSIFDAVFPELFQSRQAFADMTRDAIARRARPFLLRRLKTDVLKELPDKIESVHTSELLPEQKKLYLAYLAKLQKEALKHLNDDTFQRSRIKILAGLTRLRQLCCHPALFVEDYAGSSAKFEQLLEIIEECRSSGKRMLVFSQFTEMLGIIRRELGLQGVPHFYLDGSTPAAERVELCRRFNDGERDLFLVSMKAGGTGLNLTGADTVILYDLWWNPAVEEQAADRAHRIGQQQVVQVIRLVSRGTVEDKMVELQQKKKRLIDEVIQPGEESLSSMTEQDIRDLLMI
ncbi:SNF2 helicase associated domain-containing protein [Paenibacillus sp. NPDC056579]|uniref:DEAD/DEAH box helicase n=1 Tax=Paenibacillus sp. NPDC056579 TaxID=3345871 RepID=UPI0036CB0706